jgi:hypothetical protein
MSTIVMVMPVPTKNTRILPKASEALPTSGPTKIVAMPVTR